MSAFGPGCVPSKTLIHYASLLSSVEELQKHSIAITKPAFVNIMNLVRKKREEVYQTETPEVLKEEGIDTYFGSAEFFNKNRMRSQ